MYIYICIYTQQTVNISTVIGRCFSMFSRVTSPVSLIATCTVTPNFTGTLYGIYCRTVRLPSTIPFPSTPRDWRSFSLCRLVSPVNPNPVEEYIVLQFRTIGSDCNSICICIVVLLHLRENGKAWQAKSLETEGSPPRHGQQRWQRQCW